MFQIRKTTFAVAMAALGAGACGAAGSDAVALGDLQGSFTDAFCQHFVGCGQFTSVAECADALGPFFTLDQIIAGIDAGAIAYDGDAMGSCLAGYADSDCDQSSESARETSAACADALRGTVADGGACFDDLECLSGSCNSFEAGDTCTAGTCAPTYAESQLGQPCGDATCVSGTACNTSASNPTCVALTAEHGACAGGAACAYGLACITTTDPQAGTCEHAPDTGEACAGVCRLLGDACVGGTCHPLVDEGDACGETVAQCKAPLACDGATNVCASPVAIGRDCSASGCTSDGFCEPSGGSGPSTCAALKANGQACVRDNECQTRNCGAGDLCADVNTCP